MSKFHRRLIWEKGKDKRCNEEFVIKRINDENRFYYILAEQENCAVFISITADSEESFFLKKIVVMTNEETITFNDLNSKLIIEKVGWGNKINLSWKNDTLLYNINLYLKSKDYSVFYNL